MAASLSTFDHPAWRALAGTVLGYALVLAVVLVVLFGLPYLLFGAL